MFPYEGGQRHLAKNTKSQWVARRRTVTGQRVRKSYV